MHYTDLSWFFSPLQCSVYTYIICLTFKGLAENISHRKSSNNTLQTEELKERVYSITNNYVLTNNNCTVSVSFVEQKLKLSATSENKGWYIMEVFQHWAMLVEKKVFSINKMFQQTVELHYQSGLKFSDRHFESIDWRKQSSIIICWIGIEYISAYFTLPILQRFIAVISYPYRIVTVYRRCKMTKYVTL